jgi:hypothetical protein
VRAKRFQSIRLTSSPCSYSRVRWNSTPLPPWSVTMRPTSRLVWSRSGTSGTSATHSMVVSAATSVSTSVAPATSRAMAVAGSNRWVPWVARTVYENWVVSPGRSVAACRGVPSATDSIGGTPSTSRRSGRMLVPVLRTVTVTSTDSPSRGSSSESRRSRSSETVGVVGSCG